MDRRTKIEEFVAEGCKYEGEIVLDCLLYEAEPKDYMKTLE
jgi:hypothetical protein